MIAIEIREPGEPDVLVPVERPRPAAGCGRSPDQGRGRRRQSARRAAAPGPVSAAAGSVRHSGSRSCRRRLRRLAPASPSGRRRPVCALVSGGGYAEYCVAPAPQCLPVPRGIDLVDGGGGPGDVLHRVDERVRARPAGSGRVDSRPRRIERHRHHRDPAGRACGARVFATAGSAEKCAACEQLGAERAINYRETDFVGRETRATGGRGVDVVLDMVGGEYLQRNIESLAMEGRLVGSASSAGQGGDQLADHAQAAHDHRFDAAGAFGGREGRDRAGRPRARLAAARIGGRPASGARDVSAARRRRSPPHDGVEQHIGKLVLVTVRIGGSSNLVIG